MGNSEVVTRLLQALWNDGDPTGIESFRAPDAPSTGLTDEPLVGASAFRGFYDRFRRVLGNTSLEIKRTVEAGRDAAVHAVVIGKIGDQRVALEGAAFAEIEDGRIVKAWNVWNFAPLASALGVATPGSLGALLDLAEQEGLAAHVPRLHVEVRGSGPPVVFVHGTPSGLDTFEPIVRAIEGRFSCLIVHLPGYGKSPAPTTPLPVPVVQRALRDAVLERIDRPVALVGFSSGVYRCLALALSGEVPVSKIVGLGSIASFSSDQRAGFRQMAGALRNGVDLLDAAVGGFLAPGWQQNVSARTEIGGWLGAAPRNVLADEFEAWASSKDLVSSLQGLRVPLLLRTGELDLSTPPAKAEEIAQEVRGAEVQIARGVGHALLIEDQQATVQAVVDFL